MVNGVLEGLLLALVAITALVLMLSQNWRWSTGALAIQYLGVFLLLLPSWTVVMAAAKLIAGWIAGAVLAIAVNALPSDSREPELLSLAGRIFRLIAAVLVSLTMVSLAPKVTEWMPTVSSLQASGALILLSLGLLHLGLTSQPLRVVLGLLTAWSGFEVIYAGVENSVLVAGMLAAINMGIALVGTYLILAPSMEEAE